MKMRSILFFVVLILISKNSWGLADSFIFPVMGDGKTIQTNTEDPRIYGWNTNGNPFGNNLGYCPVSGSSCSSNNMYHPAEDWNRNDGQDGGANVYSIGNGVITRIVSKTSYGMTILVKYDLGAVMDFSQYYLSGTTPTSTYRASQYVIAQYMHIDVSSNLVEGQSVVKGQVLGKIISSFGHLHFEIMVANSSTDLGSTARNICGYYLSGQDITDNGYINPTTFIKECKRVVSGTPVKFTDSNYVYLYSNNQLWWIANETVYTLLGFRKDCNSLTADWSKIVTLPASSRANYTIRTGVIGRTESSSYDKISYRVSKINCYSANLDTTKLYILKTDDGQTKFHHVTTWETYTTLGYDPNGKDIVDISYDLFQYFGEGYSIGPTNVYEVKSYSSFLSSSTQVLEKNYSPILVPPYNLQASALDNSRLQLTWTLPDGTGEYEIRVYSGGTLIRTLSWVESIIIGNLSADTTYSFQLSIFDKINGRESNKSNQVSAKTNANPPPPPIDWTIASETISTLVDANTYKPTDEKYSHERFAGKYINYWVKIDSSNPNLSFDWRTYYTYNDERVWNAIKTTNQPAYLCQSYSYYDSVNQEYYAWHKIEANSLPYIGQYRVELWINGQNAANRCFDLTMPKPDWLRLNGNATKTSVPLFWLTMGDTNSSGDGVEVFLDDNRLIFIPGVSTGYIHTSPLACGPHTYRVREVHVYPAGTFRSPFSDPLNVMIKLDKVTGQRIN